ANNLKQIGLAYKTWALGNGGVFPMQCQSETNISPSQMLEQRISRYFLAVSNELSTPNILVCPADVRVAAKRFDAQFSSTNISYFLGLDAHESAPQSLLAGDRNLTNGLPLVNGILTMTTNFPTSWTHELHNRQGNIGLADGSVQQFTTTRLQQIANTNRLLMP
ncbi:MAG TPA: type II secretion system protein, partial [Clostridia bacterium]|nr:type II secretion system protein [Clostridia bacterium]